MKKICVNDEGQRRIQNHAKYLRWSDQAWPEPCEALKTAFFAKFCKMLYLKCFTWFVSFWQTFFGLIYFAIMLCISEHEFHVQILQARSIGIKLSNWLCACIWENWNSMCAKIWFFHFVFNTPSLACIFY